MKLKQYKLTRAYQSIMMNLASAQLPMQNAYDVYLLCKAIEPFYTFEINQRKALIERYNGEIDDGMNPRFKSELDAISFRDAITELANCEVDLDVKKIEIPVLSLGDARISPVDIASMEDFVSFI